MPIDPSTLRIVSYPDPVLRAKAEDVPEVTDEVHDVVVRMIELMREADGIGLAAPQVGLPWRLFVCHVMPDEDCDRRLDDTPTTCSEGPQVFINPSLTDYTRDLEPMEEGCLSLPGIAGEVRRPTGVTIEAIDLDGNSTSRTATGLLARCWQHEHDHLEGVLIFDRFTPLSKMKNKHAIRELDAGAIGS
ncbi:MAG: peptide deformylase [Planctomycetota bacterium]